MNEPTREQQQEFWGKHKKYTYWTYEKGWHNYPPIDLNNLFKVVHDDWEVNFYFDNCSQTHDCIITLPNERENDGSGNTREEALFWALWEVLKV